MIAAGRMTGLVGTYCLLLMVVLVGRQQFVERVVGQDRLVKWHKKLAPSTLLLLLAHAVLTTIGYAQAAHGGVLSQIGTLITTYPGMLTATAGLALIVGAAISSYQIARRHMSYETWWVVHLYTYLGIGLSYSHQLATGASFIHHPFARAFWIGLWLLTVGVVVAYRILLPVARSVRHDLKVVSINQEGPGVVSIVLSGRRLDRLPVHGGQFLQWRFLRRGLWWQAHPYSLSAMPTRSQMRVTVKRLGDHSEKLLRIRPGTRVAIEGPYGTFTRHALRSDRVLLIGAGVGVTPVRALLEDLPGGVDVLVLLRANTERDLVLAKEMATFAQQRGGRALALVGPPDKVRLDPMAINEIVPDAASRDVFMCGPGGFMQAMSRSLQHLGVPRDNIHFEEFTF